MPSFFDTRRARALGGVGFTLAAWVLTIFAAPVLQYAGAGPGSPALSSMMAATIGSYCATCFGSVGLALLLAAAFPRGPWSKGVRTLFACLVAVVGGGLALAGLWLVFEGYATPPDAGPLINAGAMAPAIAVIFWLAAPRAVTTYFEKAPS
jgi:hypothetical protein